MKVGIFGDSFADADMRARGSWFDHVAAQHDVVMYGAGGSSVTYSAYQILQFSSDHDMIVWCVTNPTRVTSLVNSASGDSWWCHVNARGHSSRPWGTHPQRLDPSTRDQISKVVDVGQRFIRDFWFWDFACLESRSLVYHVRSQVPDLLVIPCFDQPMAVGDHCLCQISRNEYPDLGTEDFYKIMSDDQRVCHLNPENNRRLGQLVCQNLAPGILHIEPDDFVTQ